MNKGLKKSRSVSQLAFDIVYSSAEMEGYSFDNKVIKHSNSKDNLKNINKQTILSFLDLEDTKVTFIMKDDNPILIAHNNISNESIEIDGLGDHFLALLQTVSMAKRKIKAKENGEEVKLLSNKFIKDINRQLLYIRQDEVAIGEYRYLDFSGKPLEVHHSMVGDNGEYKPCFSANIATSVNKNVIKKMDELVDWVNNIAFKDDRDVLLDVAEFHSRFVQIQPFRDGNKRTARLLTNYLLLINGYPMIDINDNNREEYLAYIYYSTASNEDVFANESKFFNKIHSRIFKQQGERTDENKFVPLRDFFEKNLIKASSNKIVRDILLYDNKREILANQVDIVQI